jgi:hypothetical protein
MQYPQVVQFELTTACNAVCSFCPHSAMAETGRRGKMSDELVAKILDEIAAWPVKPNSICPFLTNEPFADNRIFDVSSRIRDVAPASELTFFTNASLLNKARREAILAVPGTTKFFCSLHHVNAADYKAELGLDFDRTVDNIRGLVAESPTRVTVLKVGDGDARHNAVFCDWVATHIPGAMPMISARWNWKGSIQSWEGHNLHGDIICPRSTSLTILADGRVNLCCMDNAGEYPLGDINTQTLLEVYNSPAHAHFFSTPKSQKSPCNNCNMH